MGKVFCSSLLKGAKKKENQLAISNQDATCGKKGGMCSCEKTAQQKSIKAPLKRRGIWEKRKILDREQ